MIQAVLQNLSAWDEAICLRVFQWNGRKALDSLMITASRLGDGYFYPLIGLLVFLLDRSVAKLMLPAAAIAFAVELPLHKIIKQKIRRTRPCNILPEIRNLIGLPDEFSFPSGHTAAAFLMAEMLIVFYPIALFPAVLIAVLIGLSRIYNGVHYPGDVIAGGMLGLICAKIGLFIIL